MSRLQEGIAKVLEQPSHGDLKFNPSDRTWSAYYTLQEGPSPAWGVLLGEYAHNLRSALDNLVTYLVLRNGEQLGRRNAFPIYFNSSEWTRKVENRYPRDGALENVSEEDFAVIKDLQPFLGRDEESVRAAALGLLSRVSNADKHVALHVAMAYQPPVDQAVFEVRPRPVPVEIVWAPAPFTRLEAGAEMSRIRFLGAVPKNVKVGFNWPLAVMFVDHRGRMIQTGDLWDIHRKVFEIVCIWDEVYRELGRGEEG